MTRRITLLLCFLIGLQISLSQEQLKNNKYHTLITDYIQKEFPELQPQDYADLYVTRQMPSSNGNVTYIYIKQRYQGIEIYNAISSISVQENEVVYMGNRLYANLTTNVNTTTPIVTALDAIYKLAVSKNLEDYGNIELLERNGNQFTFSSETLALDDIKVNLVYQPTTNNQLHLAWGVRLHTADNQHFWSVRVDAVDGSILEEQDLVVNCNFSEAVQVEHDKSTSNLTPKQSVLFSETNMPEFFLDGSQYNVIPLPGENPDTPFSIVTDPSDVTASPFGWHDTDGVTGAEYTITRGNNVYAAEGTAFAIGTSPDGGATLDFSSTPDISGYITSYTDYATRQLFYSSNKMHDILYHYGFDEISGNFQETNYTGQGLGADYVQVSSHDGNGLNNAQFFLAEEGSVPTLRSYLWYYENLNDTPLTVNNTSLAGTYSAVGATFGVLDPSVSVTADLAVIDGGPSGNYEACNDIVLNPADVAGKIVVIRRGNCTFMLKTLLAFENNAAGVIIVNNSTDPLFTIFGIDGGLITIPLLFVSQADGEALLTEILNGTTVNATIRPVNHTYKDAGFDNGITAHEYVHGLTSRLIGGANDITCLLNSENLSEGFSDWYALMTTITDPAITTREMGVYVNNGVGIRLAPYSPDFSINDYTYADTNDITINSVVHNIGFIWATMLWDLSLAYIEKYGYDYDVINGNGGNNRVMQVVTESLKLLPCSPGFVDGRSAILAADMALTGGHDQCLIWEVFANRGLGYIALQGSTDSVIDQTESYATPAPGVPSLANCTTFNTNSSNLQDAISVYPNPATETINFTLAKSHNKVSVRITDVTGKTVLQTTKDSFENGTSVTISQLVSGMYILQVSGDTIEYTTKIIKN